MVSIYHLYYIRTHDAEDECLWFSSIALLSPPFFKPIQYSNPCNSEDCEGYDPCQCIGATSCECNPCSSTECDNYDVCTCLGPNSCECNPDPCNPNCPLYNACNPSCPGYDACACGDCDVPEPIKWFVIVQYDKFPRGTFL